MGNPHSAIGLAARAPAGRRAAPCRLRPPAKLLPTHAPLAAGASLRRSPGRGGRRRQAGARALQPGGRRRGAVRQADGPQRGNLEPRLPSRAGRPAGRSGGACPGGPAACRGRPVRLPHAVSGDARGRPRGILAPPAGRLFRPRQRRAGRAGRRPAGLSDRLRLPAAAVRSAGGALAAAAGPPAPPGRPAALDHDPRAASLADDVQCPQAARHLGATRREPAAGEFRPAVAHAAERRVA